MRRLLIILFFLPLVAQAQTSFWFADAAHGGSDANPGTQASPYLSHTKFNSIQSSIHAGDSVMFENGSTFTGNWILTASGTVGDSIYVRTWGSGPKPVFTGFLHLTGGTNEGNNVWGFACTGCLVTNPNQYGNLVGGVNMVTMNDTVEPLVRFPEYCNTCGEEGGGYAAIGTVTHTGTTGTITDTNSVLISLGAGALVGGEFAARVNQYTIIRYTITQDSIETPTQQLLGYSIGSPFYSAPAGGGWGFFAQNSYALFSTPGTHRGEWYYNPTNDSIYVNAPEGPTVDNIEVTTTDTLFTSKGRYISISGLNFTGANHYDFVSPVGHFTLENCDAYYSGMHNIFIGGSITDSVFIIQNDSLGMANAEGIANNFPQTGVTLWWNFTLQNNYDSSNAMFPGMAPSYFSYTGFATHCNDYGDIYQNYIINTGYNGIGLDGHYVAVHNNVVKNPTSLLTDGAGIYFNANNLSQLDSGVMIDSNLVFYPVGNLYGTALGANPLNSGGQGIYLDQKANGVSLTGNTIVGASESGIKDHDGHSNTFRNNTYYGNRKQGQQLDNDGLPTLWGDTVENGIFISTLTGTTVPASFWQNWLTVGNLSEEDSAGLSDNNYYAHVVNDTVKLTYHTSSGTTNAPLSTWQINLTQDPHSTRVPYSYTTLNLPLLIYDSTPTSISYPLPAGNYVDVNGNAYAGSASLAPFTSLVLFYADTLAVLGEYQMGILFGTTLKTAGGGSTGQGSSMIISTKGILGNIAFNDGKTRQVLTAASGLHTMLVVTPGPTGTFAGDTLWMTGLNDGHLQGSSTAAAQSVFVPIPKDNLGNALTNIAGVWMSATPGLIDTTAFAYAWKTDGTLWLCGNSTGGLTGDGTTGNSAHVDSFFTQVPTPSGGWFVDKVVGMFFPMVHDTTGGGTAWTWGNQNYSGWQLGQSGDYRTPHKISISGHKAIKIASNSRASYIIDERGRLWGWSFYSALLGIGTHWSGTTQVNTPTDITTSQGTGLTYKDIACIEETTIAIMSDSTARTWGDNPEGTAGVAGDAGYQINMWATTPVAFNYDGGIGENIVPSPLNPFACGIKIKHIFPGGYYQRDWWISTYNGWYHLGRNKNAVGLFVVNGDPTFNQEADYPDWANDTIPQLRNLLATTYTVAEAGYCTANHSATACRANYNPPGEANPTVSAGSNFSTSLGSTPTLSGSATAASGHSISGYRWSTNLCGVTFSNNFASGPNVSGLPVGIDTLTLTATDDHDAAASANVIVTVTSAAQTGYYFAASGSGTACTHSLPCPASYWNTLYAVATAGDTFYMNRGDVFPIEMVANSFGSAGNPIVVKPYGTGADPVVGGLTTLSGWTNVSGNVWEVPYTGSWLNLAVYNGALMTQARTPNLTTGYFIPTSINQTSITDAAHAGMVTTGTKIAARTSAYTIDSAHVTGVSSGVISVSPSFTYNPAIIGGDGWMIMNNTPDTTGEWQDTLGQVRVYSVGSPSGTWQAPAEDTLLLDEGGYQEWDSIDFRGGNKANVILAFQANANIAFKGCISEYGIDGYQFRSDGAVTIIGGQVQHLTNDGKMKVNANNYNEYDSGFTVYDIGMLPGMGRQGNQQPVYAGWVGGDSASTVVNLVVDSTGAAGIINYGSGFKVNYNSIRFWCQILEDQAAVYTWMTSGTLARWREIFGNYAHAGGSAMSHNGSALDMSASGVGIYLDNYSYMDSVAGNTIDGSNSTALYDHGPTNVFTGNLTYNSGFAAFLAYELSAGPTITGLIVTGNSFNAISSSTYLMYLETANNDIAIFGTFNNNAFNHQNATSAFYKKDNTGAGSSMNFATWKSTYSGYESTSAFAQNTLSLAGNLGFSTQAFALPGVYKDLNGKIYYNKITLPQLSGKLLQLINPGQWWRFRKHP